MTYDVAIENCSSPFFDREAVMTYEHGREFYEGRRDPDISLPREIVATAIFTAGMVGAILFVLCNFIL